MKTAIVLLAIGLFLALAGPYLWGDRIGTGEAQLPQFVWSKSPPRVIRFTAVGLFRAAGVLFVVLAALCFMVFRTR
jgi:hypothetical protein